MENSDFEAKVLDSLENIEGLLETLFMTWLALTLAIMGITLVKFLVFLIEKKQQKPVIRVLEMETDPEPDQKLGPISADEYIKLLNQPNEVIRFKLLQILVDADGIPLELEDILDGGWNEWWSASFYKKARDELDNLEQQGLVVSYGRKGESDKWLSTEEGAVHLNQMEGAFEDSVMADLDSLQMTHERS